MVLLCPRLANPVQVVAYGRAYRFSQARYDQARERLQQLERLVKQYDVDSADELLWLAEEKVWRRDA